MNNTIQQAELVDDQPSNAIALRPAMSVGQAMSVQDILAQVKLVQDVMRSVMKEGEHFGKVPGCGDKKVLLQPGAQKLTMTFRLAPEYEIQEVNLEHGHKEYRVICTLKSMGSGSFVGQGVGCCSSMESKYRWRGGSRKCPECGKETIIKGKAEYGGGWLCYQKKGGCGAKWPDGNAAIEGQSIERVENPDPADTFNTVLKMAKKRAFVDATITATAASDIFTQDLIEEDIEHPQQMPLDAAARQKATSEPSKRAVGANAAQSAPKEATAATRTWMIEQLGELEQPALQYFIESGVILPNETLQDVPLHHVPTSKWNLERLKKAIETFKTTGKAEKLLPPEAFKVKEKPATSPDLDPEWWRDVIVPIPHKGQKRDDYLKDPERIGQLFELRHEDETARSRLFGFLHNFTPKPWMGKDGKERPPSDSDKQFRKALDAFAEWLEKTHPEEFVET